MDDDSNQYSYPDPDCPLADELIRIIGKKKTRMLLDKYGGLEFRFPIDPNTDRFLEFSKLVGHAETVALGAHFGRGDVYIPMLSQWRKKCRLVDMKQRYDDLLKEGKKTKESANIIAREFGHSERWVRDVVNR